MVYAAPSHVWNWTPRGPARRLTGEEVTERVLGRCAPWHPKDPLNRAIYEVVMQDPPVFRAAPEDPS